MRVSAGRLGTMLPPILWAGVAFAQNPARPSTEAIGSWVLSCPRAPAEPCGMRHRDWLWPPVAGGPSASVEVQMRDGALVPIVVVRGLSGPAMLGALAVANATVTVAFDGGRPFVLKCGSGGDHLACVPDPSSAASIAQALPLARVLSAVVTLSVPSVATVPSRDISLDLAGTELALARLRAVGPAAETMPAYPGLDLWGLVNRIAQNVGIAGGAVARAPRAPNAPGR